MSVSSCMATASVCHLNRLSEIVNFGAATYSREATTGTIQALRFRNNGDLDESGSVGSRTGATPGTLEWHVANPNTNVSDWELLMSVVSGSFSTSAGTGPLALTTSRSYTRNALGSVTADFTIRLIADNNISVTRRITLSATDVPK